MPSTPSRHRRRRRSRATRSGSASLNRVQLMLTRKPAALGCSDRRDGAVVDAGLAHRRSCICLVAVEMDRPDEERAGLVMVQPLFHQQRVGAQVDESCGCDHAPATIWSHLRCAAAARRRRWTRPARRIRRPPPGIRRRSGAGSGSRRDSRSCRSRRRRDCSGTAAPASAPADSACDPRRCWRTT